MCDADERNAFCFETEGDQDDEISRAHEQFCDSMAMNGDTAAKKQESKRDPLFVRSLASRVPIIVESRIPDHLRKIITLNRIPMIREPRESLEEARAERVRRGREWEQTPSVKERLRKQRENPPPPIPPGGDWRPLISGVSPKRIAARTAMVNQSNQEIIAWATLTLAPNEDRFPRGRVKMDSTAGNKDKAVIWTYDETIGKYVSSEKKRMRKKLSRRGFLRWLFDPAWLRRQLRIPDCIEQGMNGAERINPTDQVLGDGKREYRVEKTGVDIETQKACQKILAVKLRDIGMSDNAIAKAVGMSQSQVGVWLGRAKVAWKMVRGKDGEPAFDDGGDMAVDCQWNRPPQVDSHGKKLKKPKKPKKPRKTGAISDEDKAYFRKLLPVLKVDARGRWAAEFTSEEPDLYEPLFGVEVPSTLTAVQRMSLVGPVPPVVLKCAHDTGAVPRGYRCLVCHEFTPPPYVKP